MSHSPQKSESMFLQRVQSSRLIIECKLGLTSLHDFVVHQVFCTFVLSVKGSHGPKGCRFSCLEKKTFIYNPIFSSKEIMCVCCTKWRCRKSWICIWLRKFQYMMTDTSCDHVQARARALHRFCSYSWWMHRCICLLSRTHSLKKLLYWCESLFLGAVVCIRQGVHI